MSYYNINKNTEYIDEFIIPKKKKKPKKRNKKNNIIRTKYNKIIFLVLIILIIFILSVGIIFFTSNKLKIVKKDYNLKNIIINDNSYSPNFSSDIYDYYLLTDDNELKIECDINKKVNISGCNEVIDLSNYASYIHKIVLDDEQKTTYKINIRVRETVDDENISIDSITGNDLSWTNKTKEISINASSKNKIKGYSIDNGLTWSNSNKFKIDKNSNLKIIVKDEFDAETPVRQEMVSSIDQEKPKGIIIKESSSKNKITLKVIGKDEESGVDGYSWNGDEYSNNDEYIVKKAGNYYVNIRDCAGNISKVSINVKNSDFNNKKQVAVTLYGNGSKTTNDFLICTLNGEKCSVTLPKIIRDNSNIIGWSKKDNSKSAEYDEDEKISIDENMVLYAITSKELIATFEENGADSISSSKEKCTIYNDEKYCTIKTPNISYANGKIIGWNDYRNASSVLESPNSTMKISDNVNMYALVYKYLKVKFERNGADSLSKNEEVCHLHPGNEKCFIKMPTISRKDAEIIGWSTERDAHDAEINVDESLETSKNLTLYAITKKDIITNFDKNGASSISSNALECSLFNEDEDCLIEMPTIYRNSSTILGWSLSQNAKEADINSGDYLTVNKSNTYYAITFKKLKANFNRNGVDKISFNDSDCTLYNNQNGCEIKTPTIDRKNWNIVGWSTNKNAKKADAKVNSEIKINKNTNFYAITYKKLKATFLKNNADSLGNCTNVNDQGCVESCNIYNNNKSCEVRVPYIYSKGNEVQFFSTSSDPGTTVGYSPAVKLNLYKDIKLNAIVDNRYRSGTYSIIKTKNYGYTAFETEKGCPSSVYNNYYNFLDRLYQKAPYIFKAAKVTFTSLNTFNETWGSYAGMTYGIALGYRNTDIKCPAVYSDYYLHTIVHELVHGWDSYYKAINGIYLSDSSTFKQLYNKYVNSNKRPLRDYSYNNLFEFVADVYAWYYFIYIDNSYQPRLVKNNLYFPNDLKRAIEKYI